MLLADQTTVDFWTHPVVLLVIASVLTGVGTAVAFALKSILAGQRAQDVALGEIKTSIAVRDQVDVVENTHRENRLARIESDVASVRSDVGALHRRLDSTIEQLSAGNPEVRR